MKIGKITLICAILTLFSTGMANAQGLSDLLKGGTGNTLANILEGVFSSSNITVADMRGQWTSSGPAVCFQGEGFLKKAGGIAAAAAIEKKLDPYYKQYGLNNAVLTIDNDDTFQLKVKNITLSGTITPAAGEQKGVFVFNFKALKAIPLGSVTTYVQKTSSSMDVMFDATKLKNLFSGVAKITGISLAKTLGGILDSYDGLCVGFNMRKTGNAPAATTDRKQATGSGLGGILGGILGGGQSQQQPAEEPRDTTEQSGGSALGSILGGLLGGGQSQQQDKTVEQKTQTSTRADSTDTSNRLRNALGKKKKKK